MSTVRFGTDGLRGIANVELTAGLSLALGRAAARVLRPRAVVVGRDTRRSGPMLQAALAAGLAAEGTDVVDVGVLPTPAVAYLAEREGVPAAVVSASHNPFDDNGIKLFGGGGTKLTEEVEREVERELDRLVSGSAIGDVTPFAGRDVGRVGVDPTAASRYVHHLVDRLGAGAFEETHLVIDCANGAASAVAPEVFRALGARVTAIHCEPDGMNINDACGSTAPGALARTVVEQGADLGLAFDGDADRLVAVDHSGAVTDGDVLLALFALDLADRGELVGDTVVVTVMTNLGFRTAMAARGIRVLETAVGDRHVLSALDAEGLSLGGEQSGHIVFRKWATTGDGLLTGILLVDLLGRRGRPLAELSAGLIEHVPQVQVNVTVSEPERLAEADAVWQAVAELESELGGGSRVLLRPSGTEPVVRVMVEAVDEQRAADAARRLSAAVEGALGSALR